MNVVIELSKGMRVKRHPDGSLQYISPFASPFNYGFVPGVRGGDGDPMDAIVFGPTLDVGARVQGVRVGVAEILDGGLRDDKWLICPPGVVAERLELRAFLERYKRWKDRWAWVRRREGVILNGVHWES